MTDHSPTDLTDPSYAELLAKIALLEQQQKQQQDAYQQLNRPGIVGDLIFWENTTMNRQYTPEIKERAVRMLIEAARDYP